MGNMSLYLDANALADSLKGWLEPNAEKVISAALNKVEADITSCIIWGCIMLLFSVISYFLFTKTHRIAKTDGSNEGAEYLILIGAIIATFISIGCFTKAITFGIAPEFAALSHIVNFIR